MLNRIGSLTSALKALMSVARGKMVRFERQVQIGCQRCDAGTSTIRRIDVASNGIQLRDPVAPTGWGIRYQRRDGMPPLPQYFCSSCSEALKG